MALYEFRDTSAAGSSRGLPAEAVSLNGVYIENEVPGYRTLSVRGREQQDVQISEIDNDYHDGGLYRRKRYRSRTITVRYQLIAASNTAFRNAYNRLHAILDQEEMQVIFRDEEDKYYTGTCSDIRDVDEGTNAVVGEYEIFCADPKKYSVQEYTAEADENGQFLIDYNGTAPAFPVITTNVNSSLGFIGFVDGDAHVIQIGDPEEDDTETYDQSTNLINDNFVKNVGTLNNWPSSLANAATIEQRSPVVRDRQLSTIAENVSSGTNNGEGVVFSGTLSSLMSTSSTARWAGPSRTKQLSQAAENFTVTMNYVLSDVKKYITNKLYTGEIRLLLTGTVDGTKKSLASVHIFVDNSTDNQVGIAMAVLDKQKKTIYVAPPAQKQENISGSTPAQAQSLIKKLCKSISIEKLGSKWTFNTEGGAYSYTVSGTENYAVSEVSMWILFYSKVTSKSGSTYTPAWNQLDLCGVRSIKFTKHEYDLIRDIPNPFSDGDEVVVDCKTGEIRVNQLVNHNLGALGNDWEKFSLKPGANVIQCTCSTWAQESPDYTLTYRKVYL